MNISVAPAQSGKKRYVMTANIGGDKGSERLVESLDIFVKSSLAIEKLEYFSHYQK